MVRIIRSRREQIDLIGAVIGDIIGSRFEFHNIDTKDFELFTDECCFTDDTVMTCAVAETLMQYFNSNPFAEDFERLDEVAVRVFHEVGREHPYCGYGGKFFRWMLGNVWVPYNSCGNGSAMRISPVGDMATSVQLAMELSLDITKITHNHLEGLKGAEACAVAKVLLKRGMSKEKLREYIEENYYKLGKTVDQYREENKGEHGREICQITVPQAFVCFFEGENFEDVIRNCISIGGDSDTIAAIAGGIAEAYYVVPEWMVTKAKSYLTPDLLEIVERWEKFCDGKS